AEKQKNAFFKITRELGYNPDSMPVSKKPNYGCGGAMGPAQFLPSTWLLFDDKVSSLTGHNPPDPWKVEDAFTAAALYLADAGATAKTQKTELRAAKAYISGSPNCTKYICNFYSREVLRIAALIEPNL
ncbi:MAG: lytic murein transglycosylase, partial [Patescibacteria group bacterium]